MKDLLHIIAHSFVMYGIVFVIVHYLPNLWSQLFVGTFAGAIYYFIGAYLMKFDEFSELLSLLKLKKA